MVRVDGKNVVQRTTKTESGKRTIPLNGQAMEAVRHLKAQRIVGCPYVFATQTGMYLSYRNLLAMMEKACEVAGVEHRGLHALYARGVEVKIISKLLGHASVEIIPHIWKRRNSQTNLSCFYYIIDMKICKYGNPLKGFIGLATIISSLCAYAKYDFVQSGERFLFPARSLRCGIAALFQATSDTTARDSNPFESHGREVTWFPQGKPTFQGLKKRRGDEECFGLVFNQSAGASILPPIP